MQTHITSNKTEAPQALQTAKPLTRRQVRQRRMYFAIAVLVALLGWLELNQEDGPDFVATFSMQRT